MKSKWHIYLVGLCFFVISAIYFGLYYYTSSKILLALGIVTVLTIVGLFLRARLSKYLSYISLGLVMASVTFNTVKGPKGVGHSSSFSIVDLCVLGIVVVMSIYCVVVIHLRFKKEVVKKQGDVTA